MKNLLPENLLNRSRIQSRRWSRSQSMIFRKIYFLGENFIDRKRAEQFSNSSETLVGSGSGVGAGVEVGAGQSRSLGMNFFQKIFF